MRQMPLGIVLALATACADASSKPTVTVCKGDACREQDKSVVTYDPATDGVRQDSDQALKWMRNAAERGDRQAQTAVGRLYYTGLEEMGSDRQEAEKWLSAAGRGDKEAGALLAEVRQALASDEAYRRRLANLRATTSYWWYRGWSYRWYWDPYRRTYLSYL